MHKFYVYQEYEDEVKKHYSFTHEDEDEDPALQVSEVLEGILSQYKTVINPRYSLMWLCDERVAIKMIWGKEEFKLQCKVQNHCRKLGVSPKILRTHQNPERNEYFIVSEYIKGEEPKTLKDEKLITMIHDLEKVGITQTDLHCGNFIVSAEGKVLLVDFESVRVRGVDDRSKFLMYDRFCNF